MYNCTSYHLINWLIFFIYLFLVANEIREKKTTSSLGLKKIGEANSFKEKMEVTIIKFSLFKKKKKRVCCMIVDRCSILNFLLNYEE